ncbi:MAG: glycogen/starch synthase, partial [Verrucomicrobiota bacterium]|nr:glycogen/starch synthase [Verrucomicrobiota bacterium]
REVSAEVWMHEPHPGLTVYFVDQPGYYDRGSLYQERGGDYADNAERFIFLSKAVAHMARYLDWQPEIVHLHDWQVALASLFVLEQAKRDGWRHSPGTCLTIHNLAYQGFFPRESYELTNLPWEYFRHDGAEFFGGLNCLKAGISYSDVLTTVSPRYAREITTEEYGCGLDPALRARQQSLFGILNGVDYGEWNTERNPYLPEAYSAEALEGKGIAKRKLQKEMGLPERGDVPLFGSVTRLADQKGVDISIAALEEMLAADIQFVLLGSGQAEFETAFQRLALRHQGKVAVRLGYNQGLAHRIEAGCDFFLMPSRFEPCGLNQMYSLRYGTIPIVRVTGGLDDSVVDIAEDLEAADGIKFYEYSARALTKAIRKAIVLFQEPELLEHYRLNGMRVDFSWEQTTEEYLKVYEKALESAKTRA